ncbi:FitA-like ribbon-helix-helix domain-containing protein [Blastococcus sp. SYSU DS0539]
MGSLLQIRDVPDDVRRALKERAAAQGESLNRYLLDVLTREVAQPTVREVLDRAARRAGRGGIPVVGVLDEARREREGELAPRRP